jgi:capsular exopolysaccharide synthesis family protein
MIKDRKKIPILNEKLDPYILWFIVKRSIIISIIYLVLCLVAAFLYIRYTPPLYKASAVIQIKKENNPDILLDLTKKNEEINVNQIIELIRSPEFLKRVINKLPLDVSYFAKGTFLEFEMYKSSPFEVEFSIKNPQFWGIPIYVFFPDDHAKITYKLNGEEIEKDIPLNQWSDVGGLLLKVTVKDFKAIKEQLQQLKKDAYFIVINNEQELLNKLMSNLNVFLLNAEANTIQISCTDRNAQKVADLVKTISEEFIVFDLEMKIESSKKIVEFLDQQTKILYKTIDSLEERLIQYNYKLSSTPDDENQTLLYNKQYEEIITSLNKEIEDIELKIMNLNNFIKFVKSNPNISSFELISFIPETDNLVLNIVSKIQNLEEQKEQLLASKTANSFQIKTLENQIDKHKKTLIQILNNTLQRLEDKKKLYLSKIEEYKSKKLFNKSTLSDLDYLKLKRLYDINIGYYNKLLEKKAEYLINQAGSVSQNIILQNALIPTEPITISRETVLFIFIVLSILMSIITIIIRYLLYNEITSVEDIKIYTDAKILGIIPLYKSNIQISKLLVDVKPNSIFTESFRACRASIEFLQKEKNQNIIAISSTVSGEGKTFFAINLAGVFAMQNKKVLLIDSDLRRPRIHLSFNVDNSKGLSAVLVDKIKIEDCIKKTKMDGLYIVTAGVVPPNPSELLNSKKYEELLFSLSELYDYIIIDTPPLGFVSDALSAFKIAHFPVYILKSHFSKRTFLYNINHLIDEKKINNLLVVVNGFDFEKSKYSYQYAYSYNYAYGYTSDQYNHYYDDTPIKKKSWIKKLISQI